MRELISPDEAQTRAGFFDTRGGDGKIIVLLQSRFDQFLQCRILKQFPPFEIGDRCTVVNGLLERDRFFDTLDLMLAGEEKPPWKDRLESERFLDSVMLLLRDMAASKGGSPDLMNEDMAPEITEMGTHAPLKRILESYERIRKLRGQLFFNLNRGITWNYTASLLEGLRLHG